MYTRYVFVAYTYNIFYFFSPSNIDDANFIVLFLKNKCEYE